MSKVLVLLSLACLALSIPKTTPLQGGDEWIGTDVPGYTSNTFSTWIDHWGVTTDKFSMRYFVNDKYFDKTKGGPLIFYCGNEGPIEMFITATGQITNIAQATKGLIVFGEHRYFGDSMPFGKESYTQPGNLIYLSPHQALADYAYLITYLKTQEKIQGVLVLGGSYGGMLAAWFRMKYPHLVDGALAASAPLNHFDGTVVPELFNEIISNDFKLASADCYTSIQNGFLKLQTLAGESTNYKQLQTMFNTCETVTAKNVGMIYDWLNNAYTYMAMTDYPYPTNFLNPQPAWPVKAACTAIADEVAKDKTDWGLMTALRNAAQLYYNYDKKLKCNQIEQDYDNFGQSGWDYLACTTLIMPIGANGKTDFFLPAPWSTTDYVKNCETKYSNATYTTYSQTDYAQQYYGASSDYAYTYRSYSNIIFSNGELDPWQSGAVTKNFSDSIYVINIADAAHHLDLRADNPADPPSVVEARKLELAQIKKYLGLADTNDDPTFLSN